MPFELRIEINPRICGGKPVIRGTRIPASVLLDQLASGETWEGILKGYPELKREDIAAALVYAKDTIDHTDLIARTSQSESATLS